MNAISIPTLVAAGYLITNALCLMAYWPQLKSVLIDKVARSKIVPFTWWIWTIGGATECLYAASQAHQWMWACVASVHMVACATVATLGSLHALRARRTAATTQGQAMVLQFRRPLQPVAETQAPVQARVPA